MRDLFDMINPLFCYFEHDIIWLPQIAMIANVRDIIWLAILLERSFSFTCTWYKLMAQIVLNYYFLEGNSCTVALPSTQAQELVWFQNLQFSPIDL